MDATPDNVIVPGFDEIADELYGLPLEEFTAARTRLEKQARADGDRDAATAIKALGKPNVTAWLANQLARRHEDELRQLVEVGAALREATQRLAGDQLRELSKQRNQVVLALVQLARGLGRPVSADVARGLEDTLHAAMVDERAAEELLRGRLTEGLHRTGLGDQPDATVIDLAAARRSRRAAADEELAAAEKSLAVAREKQTQATEELDRAHAQAAESDEAAQAARARVEDLQTQLDEATSAAADADRRRREHYATLQRALRAVQVAERRLDEAEQRRDRLTD